LLKGDLDAPHVDFRFSASGDSVQEQNAEFARFHLIPNPVQRQRLLLCEQPLFFLPYFGRERCVASGEFTRIRIDERLDTKPAFPFQSINSERCVAKRFAT
jgi:hypothetical protein